MAAFELKLSAPKILSVFTTSIPHTILCINKKKLHVKIARLLNFLNKYFLNMIVFWVILYKFYILYINFIKETFFKYINTQL